MKAGGGLITKDDLAAYQANERKPIHGTYRGYDVYGPPPPSLRRHLPGRDAQHPGELRSARSRAAGRPQTLHLMIETMRRAYCDRARYLGDPDFTKIPDASDRQGVRQEAGRRHRPQQGDARAKTWPRTSRWPRKATAPRTSPSSTSDGMAVANTYTLEHSYGSRIVVKGAGFLLNNEMMDFNWQPGVTDREGQHRHGAEPDRARQADAVSRRRRRSWRRTARSFLVTGSPGSRTIINTVLCIVVNVIDFDMDIRAGRGRPAAAPSVVPGRARFEGTRDYADAVKALKKMGHKSSAADRATPTRSGSTPRQGCTTGPRING